MTHTKVATRCPRCGDVTLPAEHVWCDADVAYCFTCPKCKQGVRKRSDAKILKLLDKAGVLDIETIVRRELGSLRLMRDA